MFFGTRMVNSWTLAGGEEVDVDAAAPAPAAPAAVDEVDVDVDAAGVDGEGAGGLELVLEPPMEVAPFADTPPCLCMCMCVFFDNARMICCSCTGVPNNCAFVAKFCETVATLILTGRLFGMADILEIVDGCW